LRRKPSNGPAGRPGATAAGCQEGRKDDYLEIAAALRADLDRIDGFISIERFHSLSDPEKLLSLSF
jgi:heme-degrading monooxygenase HmoA